MHVLRTGSSWKLTTIGLRILEKLEALGDGGIARIKLGSAGIRVDGISDLVIATFVKASEVKPNFRNVWVDANGSRIGIKCVTELVDLEVEDTN